MKIKNLFYKLRHFIAIGCILLAGAFCYLWINENTVEEATDMWHRTIANDFYSVLTEDIVDEKGIVQDVLLLENLDVYGVNLNFHTYGQICQGTIYVDMYDTDGNLVAKAQDDLSTVYNDNFKRFMFDNKIDMKPYERHFALHIYTSPATENDKVALWKNAYTFDNLNPIIENGKETPGVIAYQFITSYVDGQMAPYFKILATLMVAFLVVTYIVVFVLKAKIHNIFLVFALGIGIIFSIFTPLRGAPDEYTHMGMSYYTSNNIMGIKDSYQNGKLLMRECDYGNTLYPASSTAFELREIYDGLFKTDEGKTELIPVWTRWSEGYFPPLYWAQALGITLARILGLGRIPMYVFGRLGNLVLYTLLIYFAIRRMPIFKTTMAAVALTPIALQLAASFTYDTLVIGMCFLFTATVFDLAYNKEKVKLKDVILLALLAAIIAPCKAVYILIVALCFIIPMDKFGGKIKALASFAVIAVVAVSMWLAYNQTFIGLVKESLFPQQTVEEAQPEDDVAADAALTETADIAEAERASDAMGENTPADVTVTEEVTATEVTVEQATAEEPEPTPAPAPEDDLLENGDSRYLFSAGYILTHIPQTIKLIVNTIQDNTSLYIYQIFGGILGEVILSPVQINWLYVLAVMAIVYMTTVKQQDEQLQYKGAKRWWSTLVALGVVALFCTACITWTPVNYETVFGIQGRYFLPVLPLLIMALSNKNITVKKNIDKILFFALAVVNILIILDGFTIIALNDVILY
ncbi:MAG: DUF2142 domain-containing protein [Oscillospiraceae bacterium]|nr:DUF2142 domain-containing protein [Oscillospiraceae bacterium]